MNKNIKCNHYWVKNGTWDGRTSDGRPTGGIMYKCEKCGEKASSKEEIIAKGGGEIKIDTDIYGKPLKK